MPNLPTLTPMQVENYIEDLRLVCLRYIEAQQYVPTWAQVPATPLWIDQYGQLRIQVSGLLKWDVRTSRRNLKDYWHPINLNRLLDTLGWPTISTPSKGKRYRTCPWDFSESVLNHLPTSVPPPYQYTRTRA